MKARFYVIIIIGVIFFLIFASCKKKEEAPAPEHEPETEHKQMPSANAPEAPNAQPEKMPLPHTNVPKSPPSNRPERPISKYSTKIVDHLVAMLEMASFAFKTPSSIDIKDSAQIELKISKKLTEVEIRKSIGAKGAEKVECGPINISNKIQATLTSMDFEITSLSPDTQLLTSSGTIAWEWKIKPLHVGTGRLHLSVNAVLDEGPYVLRSLDKEISVTITGTEKIKAFIDRNWEYLKWCWTAIFVPIFIYFWKKYNKKTKLRK